MTGNRFAIVTLGTIKPNHLPYLKRLTRRIVTFSATQNTARSALVLMLVLIIMTQSANAAGPPIPPAPGEPLLTERPLDRGALRPVVDTPWRSLELPETSGRLLVGWDCYLMEDVSCQELRAGVFGLDRFIDEAPQDNAEIIVHIEMRALPPTGDQYLVSFMAKGEFADLPPILIPPQFLLLQESWTAQAKTQHLIRHIVHGLSFYHNLVNVQADPQGVLTFKVNGDRPGKQVAARKLSPFYGSVSGGGNVSGSVNTTMSGWAAGSVGYNDRIWFGEIGADGSVNFILAGDASSETCKDKSAAFGAVSGWTQAGRAVSKHWSVMILTRARHDPANNWNARAQAHAGIEYALVPFRDDPEIEGAGDNAFSVSYVVGGNYENYVRPNLNDRSVEWMATHALSVFWAKHFKTTNITVQLNAGATSLLRAPFQYAVGTSASFNFPITQNLQLTLSGNFGYRQNLVNAPKEADPNANCLLPFIGAGSATVPLSFSARIGIEYLWMGDAATQQNNQRWPNSRVPINF